MGQGPVPCPCVGRFLCAPFVPRVPPSRVYEGGGGRGPLQRPVSKCFPPYLVSLLLLNTPNSYSTNPWSVFNRLSRQYWIPWNPPRQTDGVLRIGSKKTPTPVGIGRDKGSDPSKTPCGKVPKTRRLSNFYTIVHNSYGLLGCHFFFFWLLVVGSKVEKSYTRKIFYRKELYNVHDFWTCVLSLYVLFQKVSGELDIGWRVFISESSKNREGGF